jgi:hypothetical protein
MFSLLKEFCATLNIDKQITYSLTGHDLNIATIFSALQLFNVRETQNMRQQDGRLTLLISRFCAFRCCCSLSSSLTCLVL